MTATHGSSRRNGAQLLELGKALREPASGGQQARVAMEPSF